MASTYSSNLKIELMGTGDQVGSWGTTTNNNFQYALEEAIVGYVNVQFTNDANLTISLADSNASQTARNYFLYVTSTVTLTQQRDLIVPTIEKPYVVHNNTTGSQAIRVKTSAGTGIVVPSGKKMILYVDGTNVVEQADYATSFAAGSLSVTTPLPIASGGTGASTDSGARTNLGLGTMATQAANNVAITGGSISGITDLAIADGGTGASTATGALNNLLPTQTSNNGKYLKTDGTNASWDALDISTADITGTLPIANGGTNATTASGARTSLGLGTIATQDANNVAITGGAISGITDLAVSDGGTGASTASGARTNLGLGTISTQDANNVAITGGSVTGVTFSSSSATITGGSISGITDLAVADGGTGASSLTGYVKGNGTSAFTASSTIPNTDITGLGTIATQNANNVSITGGSITGITDLAVADGGTGASTFTANNVLLGNGTSAFQTVAPSTSGNVLTSNGTTWTSAAIPSQITRVTAQATTSGTSFDFTGIPSTVKRITVLFDAVTVADRISIQLGDSGGIETTGYDSVASEGGNSTSGTPNGFIFRQGNNTISGSYVLYNISGNVWVGSGVASRGSGPVTISGGTKTLSAVLTQLRITTDSTTAAFTAGSINAMYE